MKDDQEWCMDVFDHFVLAGQSATVGEAVVRRYRPVSADNDHIVLHIFSSERDDCKVCKIGIWYSVVQCSLVWCSIVYCSIVVFKA